MYNNSPYSLGLRWCARCMAYRSEWTVKQHYCHVCHTKMRARASGNAARKKREVENIIKRY